jgi:hypothetical protein
MSTPPPSPTLKRKASPVSDSEATAPKKAKVDVDVDVDRCLLLLRDDRAACANGEWKNRFKKEIAAIDNGNDESLQAAMEKARVAFSETVAVKKERKPVVWVFYQSDDSACCSMDAYDVPPEMVEKLKSMLSKKERAEYLQEHLLNDEDAKVSASVNANEFAMTSDDNLDVIGVIWQQ